MLKEIIKKTYSVIIGDTKEKKLDIILDHLIDSIELRDDVIYIKTKKDIAIENEGNTIIINKGVQVLLAKEIHLNPNISDLETLEINSLNKLKHIK